jgi:hypothetical protein
MSNQPINIRPKSNLVLTMRLHTTLQNFIYKWYGKTIIWIKVQTPLLLCMHTV